MRGHLLLAALTVVACGRRHETCAQLAGHDDRAATIARCSAEYERTRDSAAGVAAALAHAKRGNTNALLAWADRLGDTPAAAPVWRKAAALRASRDERAAMFAAREKALAGWRALGKPGEAAYEAHEMMRAHWVASELSAALDAARRGRELAQGSDDHEMQEATFGDLFILMIGIGDDAAARKLLDTERAKVASDDREMQFYLSFYEGQLQVRARRPRAARAEYLRALDLAPAIKDSGSVRSAHYNLVEIELDLGDVLGARTELARALALVPNDPPPHVRSAAAYYTGLVELAEHTPDKARAGLAAALAESPIDDWGWQLEYLMGRANEAANELDAAAAAYGRAIAVVDRMRRKIQNDPLQLALRDRRRDPYAAAFEVAARTGRTADALAIAEQMWTRRFAEELAAPVEPAGENDHVAARVAGLTAIAPLVTTPAGVPGAQPEPTAHDVLAFVEGRDAWWRYYRTRRGSGLERVAVPLDVIESLVATLRAHPEDRESAAKLGAALIPPSVLDDNAQPLYVVADGVLGGAPIAAFIANGRRLVEARVLAVVSSLGALTSSRPSRATSHSIVLGAPGTAPLAGATAEAQEVANRLGVRPYLGASATSDVLRGAATSSVLHIAAHGGIDPRGAFIQLADRRVDAADVIAWRIAPRLVVLASCASGARPGRTMWGAMGAAFIANGSAAVVASLWSVGDAETRRFIDAFYATGGATRPALALALAQRRAIAQGRPVSTWAPFVVLGAS